MLRAADENVTASESEKSVVELMADKGYHENGLLGECAVAGVRTYLPERKQKACRWDKPEEVEQAPGEPCWFGKRACGRD